MKLYMCNLFLNIYILSKNYCQKQGREVNKYCEVDFDLVMEFADKLKWDFNPFSPFLYQHSL